MRPAFAIREMALSWSSVPAFPLEPNPVPMIGDVASLYLVEESQHVS